MCDTARIVRRFKPSRRDVARYSAVVNQFIGNQLIQQIAPSPDGTDAATPAA